MNVTRGFAKLKRAILIGVAIVLATLTVWLAISAARDPREPSYQGRNLSQWLVSFFDTRYLSALRQNLKLDDAQREAALSAIRTIGTNAIPTALRWVSRNYDVSDYCHFTASFRGYPLYSFGDTIFNVLGTNAQSATPALIHLAGYSKRASVRQDALKNLLVVNSEDYRSMSATGPTFINRKRLIPVFIRCTKTDPDANVLLYALWSVMEEIGPPDRETAKSIITAALHDPAKEVRRYAKISIEENPILGASSNGIRRKLVKTNDIQIK